LLISLAARVVAWFIRIWVGLCRYRYVPLGPPLELTKPGFTGRYIFAFWHENLLIPAYHYSRPNVYILISKHADGEMIAQVSKRLTMQIIRGSTTRGGIEALRGVMRIADGGHLAITPDGPRGPRRQVQMGMIFLASRTGMPIVCWGVGFDRPWRAKSWDRFCVPRPFHKAVSVTTHPIVVPPDADRATLEQYRIRVQEQMDYCAEQAERIAAGKSVVSRDAESAERSALPRDAESAERSALPRDAESAERSALPRDVEPAERSAA
jgi:lysophospholipid acyltransferase (LPLAT)-like uncharacterized protein